MRSIRIRRQELLCIIAVALAVMAAFLGVFPKFELKFDRKKVGLEFKFSGAYEGYTLISLLNGTSTVLVDMDGEVFNTWHSDYKTGASAYLLENGNLLRTGRLIDDLAVRHPFGKGGDGGIIEEYTWDGELIWEFEYFSDEHLPHHDIEPLPNGNILMIAWGHQSRQEALDAGRNPSEIGPKGLCSDHIIEVNPSQAGGGEIVWQWHVWDHLIQQLDPAKANYGIIADHPERINLNPKDWQEYISDEERAQLEALGYLGPQEAVNPIEEGPEDSQAVAEEFKLGNPDWTHINSIDYNPQLDQILLSVMGFNEIWIIDHSTTTAEAAGNTGGRQGKGGELLYRWGNQQVYGVGPPEDQQLFAQHDATWIEPGYPGEGNILVFNNGRGRPEGQFSTVVEIVPPLKPGGGYAREANTPFGPVEPIWIYAAPRKEDFFGTFLSGAQRLPNGNTLICSGPLGIIFEVTADKDIVWKYINPMKPVFRACRYGTDYSQAFG